MSKSLKIKPTSGKIYVKLDEVKLGGLDTSGLQISKEKGEVIAVAADVTEYKKGDVILFKSYAVKIITEGDVKYHFIDINSNAICAIVQ